MIPWDKEDEGHEVHLHAQVFSGTGNTISLRPTFLEKGALLVVTPYIFIWVGENMGQR
jgi:hypothetical protein